MNENKYSNVLTMLLVVFIVAILGIIVYFAYDLLNSNKVNTDAQATIEEFEKSRTTVRRNVSNTTTNTVSDSDNNNIDMSAERDKLLQASEELSSQRVKTEPEVVKMEKYEVLGTIKIPKTKGEYAILDGCDKRALELAVGFTYGVGLNEVGNSVIFGHNYRNGLFFSNNKNLSNGDVVYITDKYGTTVTYEIYNIYQTEANDATYFVRDTEGRREISLQTCTDDGAKRIIIWAKEK